MKKTATAATACMIPKENANCSGAVAIRTKYAPVSKTQKAISPLDKSISLLVQEYRSKFYTEDGKFEPKYREDGKLLKNTGFKKLDLKELAKCQLQ